MWRPVILISLMRKLTREHAQLTVKVTLYEDSTAKALSS